jgi:regulatory protein
MTANSANPPLTPPPSEAELHEAALTYLARFSATEAALKRVLQRRIVRWAREAAAHKDPEIVTAEARRASAAVDAVVHRLAEAGAVDDSAFAAGRARRLARAGRSRQAIGAHLRAKGVPPEVARASVPDDPEAELGAALIFARRRRFGPFRRGEPDADARMRETAAMARAGFPRPVVTRVLRLTSDAAEALLDRLRRG